MAVIINNIIPRKYAANGAETQYTATNSTVVIDKFTVTNVTANNITISIHLVAQGDSLSGNNTVLDTKTIAPHQAYNCPEIVGQVLLNGGFIATWAGAATSLVLSASGREIT